MATRANSGSYVVRGVHKTVWTGLLNGDDGTPVKLPRFPDKTVQVKGTFGAGGTVVIEGSNDGGVTYVPLNDSRGETTGALSFTSADVRTILENTELVRPRVTGGDGTTAIEVHLVASGN